MRIDDARWFRGCVEDLAAVVLDEGDNHAVEVEEEHGQVERELEEGFLGGHEY